MKNGILKYNTSIEVCCLDCLMGIIIYPEDVVDFFNTTEIEDYICRLGWSKKDSKWRCPTCTRRYMAERKEKDDILYLF